MRSVDSGEGVGHGVVGPGPLALLAQGADQCQLQRVVPSSLLRGVFRVSLRLLYAVESPESWFEDLGSGRLDNGVAEDALDETFQALTGNDEYHVFLTEYGDNNALYVSDRTGSGFTVGSKTPSVGSEFSYRIVVKRGDIDSVRFAEAPAMEKPVGDDYSSVPPETPMTE